MISKKAPVINLSRIIMTAIFIFGYFSIVFTAQLSAVNESMTANPQSILSVMAFGLILLLFPRRKRKARLGVYPRLFRRFIAANIDLTTAAVLMFGLLFPTLILIENSSRSEWVWSWETAVSPFYLPSLTIGILSCFIGIYFYFKLHLERNRATPGQYIMGYKIVPNGTPNYNRRIWNGTFWMWLWIFAWGAKTETEGVYTWDKNSNSQAVRVE